MGIFDKVFKKAGEKFDNILNKNDQTLLPTSTAAEAATVSGPEELITPDQIQDKFKKCLDIVTEENDGKKLLAGMLKAQLEVIQSIKNPTLCNSAFDLLIETLNIAEMELIDEKELRQVQTRVSLMINSIVFFLDAYLCYMEDKHSKEGQELLKKGCNALATTANELIQEVSISNLPNIALRGGPVLVVAEKLFKNIVKEGFITKVLDFIFKGERLEKHRNDHYTFLDSAIEKLKRHKNILGKSVILSELVHNQKDKLAEHFNPLPIEPRYKSIILIPTLSILGVIILMFIILGIIWLINLTPANLDNAANNMWAAIKYSGLADGASLVLTTIITIIRKIAYNVSVNNCFKRRYELSNYYAEIADSLAS
jgi:hypothetical protein